MLIPLFVRQRHRFVNKVICQKSFIIINNRHFVPPLYPQSGVLGCFSQHTFFRHFQKLIYLILKRAELVGACSCILKIVKIILGHKICLILSRKLHKLLTCVMKKHWNFRLRQGKNLQKPFLNFL